MAKLYVTLEIDGTESDFVELPEEIAAEVDAMDNITCKVIASTVMDNVGNSMQYI